MWNTGNILIAIALVAMVSSIIRDIRIMRFHASIDQQVYQMTRVFSSNIKEYKYPGPETKNAQLRIAAVAILAIATLGVAIWMNSPANAKVNLSPVDTARWIA